MIDYNAIAKQYGATSSVAPTPTTPNVDYSAIAQKFGGTTVTPSATPSLTQPSNVQADAQQGAIDFAAGLVKAPLTMIARPIQAGAELLGAPSSAVDAVTKKLTGGLVAPVPQNASDVVKDVGRGAQTVALGAEAPLASGALFGAGSSLENKGSDALTTPGGISNTLVSTLVGMGAGKALDLVGKPLLDATGKIIGNITPKTLRDVASQGTKAVSDFMAQHELFGGAAKPLSETITKGAQTFDSGINKLFKGTGTAIKDVASSQYPNFTSAAQKHYQDIEVKGLFEPATVPGKTFNKSADVYTAAQKKGINLEKVAADNKIYKSDLVNDGKFDTNGVADALANETMSGGPEILRPALRAASPGVQTVPVADVRNEILSRLSKVPDTELSPAQKLTFARKVVSEYGDTSPTASRYQNGYNLEDLYNSKLQTSSNLYKTPKGGGVQSIADSLTAKQKQIESQVFGDLLKKNAPKELGLDKYFKAQTDRFTLANYLRTLDGNKAPQTLFQRAVKKSAQLGGASAGAGIAGPFGMFSGYRFGGLISDTFNNASNPVKVAYLNSIGKSQPEIYQIMKNYTSKAELDSLLRPKLNAPTTIYKGPTQNGIPFTPNSTGFKTTPAVETKRIFKGKK